jgi:hypothetical protein
MGGPCRAKYPQCIAAPLPPVLRHVWCSRGAAEHTHSKCDACKRTQHAAVCSVHRAKETVAEQPRKTARSVLCGVRLEKSRKIHMNAMLFLVLHAGRLGHILTYPYNYEARHNIHALEAGRQGRNMYSTTTVQLLSHPPTFQLFSHYQKQQYKRKSSSTSRRSSGCSVHKTIA